MDTVYNDFMNAADLFMEITDEMARESIMPEDIVALNLKAMYQKVIDMGLQVRPSPIHLEDVTNVIISCGYRADILGLTAK